MKLSLESLETRENPAGPVTYDPYVVPPTPTTPPADQTPTPPVETKPSTPTW